MVKQKNKTPNFRLPVGAVVVEPAQLQTAPTKWGPVGLVFNRTE